MTTTHISVLETLGGTPYRQ